MCTRAASMLPYLEISSVSSEARTIPSDGCSPNVNRLMLTSPVLASERTPSRDALTHRGTLGTWMRAPISRMRKVCLSWPASRGMRRRVCAEKNAKFRVQIVLGDRAGCCTANDRLFTCTCVPVPSRGIERRGNRASSSVADGTAVSTDGGPRDDVDVEECTSRSAISSQFCTGTHA